MYSTTTAAAAAYQSLSDSALPNVIEIEGLLFPGFGQMPARKFFPSSDVMSRARSKFFNSRVPFWAPSWPHLMGKTSFPWSARIGPKPGNSQPCYLNNVGVQYLETVQITPTDFVCCVLLTFKLFSSEEFDDPFVNKILPSFDYFHAAIPTTQISK